MAPDDSYAACRAIVRRAKSSFPLAFWLLSRDKRRAMDALYAFARISDDLADEPGDPHAKRATLDAWSKSLNLALSGVYSHPIHRALHDSVQRYSIPHHHLHDIIDGVKMDLEPVRFTTFDELRKYCHCVAGAVGLACIRIWGVRPGVNISETDSPAEAAGLAFQLTNILRDLGEDEARGRSYLPQDELPSKLDFQIERVRQFYRHSDRLGEMLTNEGLAVFRVMSGTYLALLEKIATNPLAVFENRVRVPKWRKAMIFLSAWPVKWGWR
jgi:phytoene synthase